MTASSIETNGRRSQEGRSGYWSRFPKKILRLRRIGWSFAGLFLIALIMCYLLHPQPALPPGVNVRGDLHPVADDQIRLLFDRTVRDPETDTRVIRQEIFDAALAMIAGAQRFVVADFFLWNKWQGTEPEEHRRVATELADALIARKKAAPDLAILVVSDPINRVYGAGQEAFFQAMAEAGIPVIFTDLDHLRDSNRVYAPPARRVGGWFRRSRTISRWLHRPRWPNMLDHEGDRISTIQIGRLLLFKANHRKVLIADGPGGVAHLLATSMNPADGSSAHDNIGLQISGAVAEDALKNELACAVWSAMNPGNVLQAASGDWHRVLETIRQRVKVATPATDSLATADVPHAAWDSEGAIRRRLIDLIDSAGPGDRLMGMAFYLSDRGVIDALREAAARGAQVRLILDPNKDAFGLKKIGVPNRPVAAELMRVARVNRLPLEIRWATTHGEQFHVKALALINPQTGRTALSIGSANWTRRNLQNYNLEANVYLENAPAVTAIYEEQFETAWSNGDGLLHTVDYADYADPWVVNLFKNMLYRFQERFGAGSF